MSQFLFIIPAGWTQLPQDTMGRIVLGISAVEMWINSHNYADLTTSLREIGTLETNQYLEEARLFNGDMLVVRIINT